MMSPKEKSSTKTQIMAFDAIRVVARYFQGLVFEEPSVNYANIPLDEDHENHRLLEVEILDNSGKYLYHAHLEESKIGWKVLSVSFYVDNSDRLVDPHAFHSGLDQVVIPYFLYDDLWLPLDRFIDELKNRIFLSFVESAHLIEHEFYNSNDTKVTAFDRLFERTSLGLLQDGLLIKDWQDRTNIVLSLSSKGNLMVYFHIHLMLGNSTPIRFEITQIVYENKYEDSLHVRFRYYVVQNEDGEWEIVNSSKFAPPS